ncbi:MAG: hydratase [Deltaproteobacteria bacterium]|jgi:aconitate hydratase|nr:hydratase [Deltaproteobacteria bacterium]
MITLHEQGGVLRRGVPDSSPEALRAGKPEGFRGTMAWRILEKHNLSGRTDRLELRFDALASHDITYVGIVQTARASGLEAFPLPYVLTNCHNSLCAVGGTINEDDHNFGLSAARRYGGEFVPPHLAVIHQYVRERLAGGGRMILGSDSHTRYGALGTLGIGEGGPELVKQLLNRGYEIGRPEVAAVYLKGRPRAGVGPQDIALALIRALFPKGLVKNRILEFFGPALPFLSTEYRLGIDVMSTETACLSSIWQTDGRVKKYLALHGREEDYLELRPEEGAYYDLVAEVDLGMAEPMIALPFHPSNAYSIRTFLENAEDLLAEVERESRAHAGELSRPPRLRRKFRRGEFRADQAIIAGCAGGGYENILLASRFLAGKSAGNPGFALSVYPASQPVFLALLKNGAAASLAESGAVLRTAFCGPCFGAGDVPGNNGFSLRHATRNFPNREGSQPGNGQMAFTALLDSRSIAATALRGGLLTAADQTDFPPEEGGLEESYVFDPGIYAQRVYRGFGRPRPRERLVFGPNIADWPPLDPLPENLLLIAAAAIYDEVTTTDELIPSGETSSYRSNPLRLAEFTLGRKDPGYVGRARDILALEKERKAGESAAPRPASPALRAVLDLLRENSLPSSGANLGIGSLIFALRPGDGSAREQAASCQKVLGGWANLAVDYATKRYRSNLINWGLLPLRLAGLEECRPRVGDRFFIPAAREAVRLGLKEIRAFLLRDGIKTPLSLRLDPLTEEEKQILLAGSLINFYTEERKREPGR